MQYKKCGWYVTGENFYFAKLEIERCLQRACASGFLMARRIETAAIPSISADSKLIASSLTVENSVSVVHTCADDFLELEQSLRQTQLILENLSIIRTVAPAVMSSQLSDMMSMWR